MKLFTFLIIFASYFTFGQEEIVKKLEKELNTEFIPVRSTNAPNVDSSEVILISSPNSDGLMIGLSFRGEFVRATPKNLSHPTFISTSYVSKSQYAKFINWVQDSIAREKLYFGLEEDLGATKLIKAKEYYFDVKELEHVEFDPSHRARNREYFDLNWEYKLKYDDPHVMPILADMYIPRSEFFRGERIIDPRKLIYDSKIFDTKSQRFPISPDKYDFALNAKHDFDRWSVYAYLSDDVDVERPVTNIQPFMAELYCEWLTKHVSRELKIKKKGYWIEFSLPSAREALQYQALPNNTVVFPEKDVSDHWRITNNEIRSFSEFALDSICREAIYFGVESNEQADKFIVTDLNVRNQNVLYYNETFTYDPGNRDLNREFATLNYQTKFKKTAEYDSIISWVNEACADSIPYQYSWLDAPARAVKGKVVLKHNVINPNYTVSTYELASIDQNGEPIGEDLDISGNEDGRTIRDHANTARFIRQEKLLIPNARKFPENDEIADITYEQALAYYNWKYRIDKFQKGEDWQQYVFPTEEEFNRIKKGETIIHPAQEIEYDSPVFRMVVELIPKN